MKLKTFDSVSIPNRVSNIMPRINISTKSCLFSINKGTIELMGLKDQDQVIFHQDEEEPGDWYIEKVKEAGFRLRQQAKASSLAFNNVYLAKKIFESAGCKETAAAILIAGKPTKTSGKTIYGLLTSSLSN